jgi:hypothetical protein
LLIVPTTKLAVKAYALVARGLGKDREGRRRPNCPAKQRQPLCSEASRSGSGAQRPAVRFRDSADRKTLSPRKIEAKAKGQKIQAPAPYTPKSNVINLVAALQKSLGSVKKGEKRSAAA